MKSDRRNGRVIAWERVNQALALFLLATAARAEIDTEIPDIYGRDELATTRTLNDPWVVETQNAAIQSKSAAELLHGPLRLQVRAVNSQTKQPIDAFLVHAFFVASGRRMQSMAYHDESKGYIVWASREVPIGRFESRRAAAGICGYDAMPPGQYWIQVLADGYVPKQESVAIRAGQESVTVALAPTVGLRLRLIDGATNAPMAGVKVGLGIAAGSEVLLANVAAYEGRTDEEGRAWIADLPRDRYLVEFPELQEEGLGLPESVRRPLLGGESLAAGAADKFMARVQDFFDRPHFCRTAVAVDLSGGFKDLGDVVLERAPVAEVSIMTDAGDALAFFPFKIAYGDSKWGDRPLYFATDRLGKARVPLIGFAPGREIQLSAAEKGSINTLTFKPEPGSAFPLTIKFVPEAGDVDMKLVFRDARTGERIRGVAGLIGANDYEFQQTLIQMITLSDGIRYFEAPDGGATIRHVRIPRERLELQTKVEEKDRQFPDARQVDYDHKRMFMFVHAQAEGYAPQTFGAPLKALQDGEELTFEMEAGAVVRGRIAISTGVPFTSESMKRVLLQQGDWSREGERAIERTFGSGSGPCVVFSNMVVEGTVNLGNPDRFLSSVLVRLHPDGSFETSLLRPTDRWSMSFESGFFPRVKRENITVTTGTNDLGEIVLWEGSGELTLVLTDEGGRAIEGAQLSTPWAGVMRRPGELRTNAEGKTTVDLTPLQGERVILHLAPPWGFDEENRTSSDPQSRICYDFAMGLDKSKHIELATSITWGNVLTVQIDPGSVGRRVHDYYANREVWPVEYDGRSNRTTYVAIGGAAIEGLNPWTDDFRYHQWVVLPGGLPLTSGPQELVIKDVPPGRYALRLDLGFYNPPKVWRTPIGPRGQEPLGYVEFDMPASDSTVKLDLSGSDIVVDLEGGAEQAARNETMLILEREEPVTTVLGPFFSFGLPGSAPERPLLGWIDTFIRQNWDGNREYRVARFVGVPPGKYQLKAYAGFADWMAGKTYWEKPVEVMPGEQTLRMQLPGH